jgi:HK97 family phage portal protein
MAPVGWICRNFTEAEPAVERKTAGLWKKVEDHPVAALIDAPNPFYDGDTLLKGTLVSYNLDGNAYWLKVRNMFGEVVQLWYLPHFSVTPRYPLDGSEFISWYDYIPDGIPGPIRIPVRDLIHIRNGIDPRNTRYGMSPLRPLLREVFTDEEASNFSASILRNMGVPGGVLAPKDGSRLPGKEEAAEMKRYLREEFTGDRRGGWFASAVPIDIHQFGFDPNSLMLTNLRDISEERVCAMLGIPAAVVGFGAGLQQTKVGATMRELRKMAFVSCIIPQQKSIARQVTSQLLSEFVAQKRRFRACFDNEGVSAFGEEETERSNRILAQVEKGVLRVDKAQAMLGLEVDPSQNVYLRPTSVTAVEEGDSGIAEEQSALPALPPNGNGANQTDDEKRRVLQNRIKDALAKYTTNGTD